MCLKNSRATIRDFKMYDYEKLQIVLQYFFSKGKSHIQKSQPGEKFIVQQLIANFVNFSLNNSVFKQKNRSAKRYPPQL